MIFQQYGEPISIEQSLMDDITPYMNDDVREYLHTRLAPCSPEKFLEEYLKEDKDFEELLQVEFDIEIEAEED